MGGHLSAVSCCRRCFSCCVFASTCPLTPRAAAARSCSCGLAFLRGNPHICLSCLPARPPAEEDIKKVVGQRLSAFKASPALLRLLPPAAACLPTCTGRCCPLLQLWHAAALRRHRSPKAVLHHWYHVYPYLPLRRRRRCRLCRCPPACLWPMNCPRAPPARSSAASWLMHS